jgi:hypothetical protein
VIQLVALVYLVAGRRVFAATLLFTGALFLSKAWEYSFGKIDHDILIVMVPVFLLLAGWGGKGAVRAWPLALFAVVISLAMFTAAWQKATSGWFDPTASAVFGHSLSNALSLQGRNSPAWRLAVRIVPGAGWKMLDYATVMLEASFILAVWRRWTFQIVCAVACLFHLGVFMLMQIVFLSNIVAYAAFVHWDAVAGRLGVRNHLARIQGWLRQRSDVELLSTAAVLTFLDIAWTNPVRFLISGDSVRFVLTWMAGLCAAAFLASQVLARLRR